jgi:hypothetical protein
MKVGPARYTRAGDVEFSQYENGWLAIVIVDEIGQPECKATTNLEALGAPTPSASQVWLKTWSENEGIEAALESAGVVKLTGERFHCGFDAVALLAELTPAALAELEVQRGR